MELIAVIKGIGKIRPCNAVVNIGQLALFDPIFEFFAENVFCIICQPLFVIAQDLGDIDHRHIFFCHRRVLRRVFPGTHVIKPDLLINIDQVVQVLINKVISIYRPFRPNHRVLKQNGKRIEGAEQSC